MVGAKPTAGFNVTPTHAINDILTFTYIYPGHLPHGR
jgi:hypothetical protein